MRALGHWEGLGFYPEGSGSPRGLWAEEGREDKLPFPIGAPPWAGQERPNLWLMALPLGTHFDLSLLLCPLTDLRPP